MSDPDIDKPVETFSIPALPELENKDDCYILKVDEMSYSIFRKSDVRATSYQRAKELGNFYGEYESKNELAGAFETAMADMLARSRNRVKAAKKQIMDILENSEDNPDLVGDTQSKGALKNSINVNPTDREMTNALEALLEQDKIVEVDNGTKSRDFKVNPENE